MILQRVEVNHVAQTVSLGDHATAPVVIAGPPTNVGTQGAVVALNNIGSGSVEVRVKEWDYLDGAHYPEELSLLTLPAGRYPQADGSIWEVGRFSLSGTRSWQHVEFSGSFQGTPRLFLTQQTENDGSTTVVRARNVDATGFDAALYEQEGLQDGHAAEQIGYLAVYSPSASGSVVFHGQSIAYKLTQELVDSAWTSTVAGRFTKLLYQEEQSYDTEISHQPEQVDILSLANHVFAQSVSTAEEDTAALRRSGYTPSASTVGIGVITLETLTYIHTDHLGTPKVMTDQSGVVVWKVAAKPFGEAQVVVNDVENLLRFPGQYFDQETGLHYNYFRDYDPSTGRYIESDPIGLQSGLNTYTYVTNNPVRWIDPFGLYAPAGLPAGGLFNIPGGIAGIEIPRAQRTLERIGKAIEGCVSCEAKCLFPVLASDAVSEGIAKQMDEAARKQAKSAAHARALGRTISSFRFFSGVGTALGVVSCTIDCQDACTSCR